MKYFGFIDVNQTISKMYRKDQAKISNFFLWTDSPKRQQSYFHLCPIVSYIRIFSPISSFLWPGRASLQTLLQSLKQKVGPGRECPKIAFNYRWLSITWFIIPASPSFDIASFVFIFCTKIVTITVFASKGWQVWIKAILTFSTFGIRIIIHAKAFT